MANLEPLNSAPAAFVEEAEKINAALSVCRAVKAMRGSGGIKVTVADGNILVSVNAEVLADNLDAVGFGRSPFKLYIADTLKVGVTSGTVNLVVPTLGGTALDNSTPPTLTIAATTYLWLKCVGTFGSPDSYVVTVESNTTGTLPSGTAITATGFTSFLYLGLATVASSAITSVTPYNYGNNWNVESLGSVNVWFK